jgi:chromate transporter
MHQPMSAPLPPPSLRRIAREWTRIGVIGFGGPPAHIVLLRELVVDRERWIDAAQFADAIAATALIPGPASTQLAIYCARVLGGRRGALLGALGFIVPGLVSVVALAAVFLATSPAPWIVAAGAGAGAAVPIVAVHAGLQLLPASRRRSGGGAARWRWAMYALAGSIGAAVAGASVVVVLLAAGATELVARLGWRALLPRALAGGAGSTAPVVAGVAGFVLARSVPAQIAWTACKVGALSYGGGFVVIPLMRADAVDRYGWMTDPQFLSAVAIGQVTPGPVTNTVAAVGWSAGGLAGAALAAICAFGPSIVFIGCYGQHFARVRESRKAQAVLLGSGPAALGAILGSSVPLAAALHEPWQWALLLLAAAVLLSGRVALVPTLAACAALGIACGAAGATIPH